MATTAIKDVTVSYYSVAFSSTKTSTMFFGVAFVAFLFARVVASDLIATDVLNLHSISYSNRYNNSNNNDDDNDNNNINNINVNKLNNQILARKHNDTDAVAYINDNIVVVDATLNATISPATSTSTSSSSSSSSSSTTASNTRNFLSEPVISIRNSSEQWPPSASVSSPSRRYERFLAMSPDQYAAALKSAEDNEIDDKHDKDNEDPTQPLYGIYYDCLFRLSFQCVQRKLLVFLDRLSRLKSFNLIGDMISMVRSKRDMGPKIKESDLEARLNPGEASSALSALLEYNLERFFHSHVLRVTLPAGITASVSGNARSSESLVGNTIDINITRVLEQATGRGKGDKKMKKLLGMMMTGLMGKMAFMGPMMVMMIKLKALKALILSKIALMLSLFHMFKGGGKKGGGGGHGKEVIIVHDSHGGGGHESLSSAWPSGGGGWSGGGGGWFGGQGDSYSQGPHTGGGDATYSGSDGYSVGSQSGGGGWAGGGSTGGWGRRSSSDPHWVAYRAYIPEADE